LALEYANQERLIGRACAIIAQPAFHLSIALDKTNLLGDSVLSGDHRADSTIHSQVRESVIQVVKAIVMPRFERKLIELHLPAFSFLPTPIPTQSNESRHTLPEMRQTPS
jgi:hypothetical protein